MKKISFLLAAILMSASLFAQQTTLKLPAADTSASFIVKNSSNDSLLRLNGDAGFYLGGTYGTGIIPITGAGTRLMWYPAKAAFRAGSVDGTQWNDANIGNYSVATGYKTTASGEYSTAMGYYTTASGTFAATAMGFYTKAMGNSSTAMGVYTIAGGVSSTAMGFETITSGDYSTAMGNYVSTGNAGSFIIGDNSTTTTTTTSAQNQMVMRFANGYKLFTNSDATVGVLVSGGGNSWSQISDSTKKYAFLPINGESVLKKINKFNMRTWSYKGQDSTKFRHYGPMAQEFFNAFGHDKYGVSGNDTTINQADLMGVNMTAIQALIRRTNKLNKQNTELIAENENIKTLVSRQAEEIAALKKSVGELKTLVSGITKK